MALGPDRINVFSGLALDRGAEQRDDLAWAAQRAADPAARFLLLGALAAGGRPALIHAGSNALRWLDRFERERFAPDVHATYLGDDGGGPLYAIVLDAPSAALAANELGGDWIDLRSAGVRLRSEQSGLFAYARALAHWQSRTRWCGACGAPLELAALGHRARCTNPDCALDHFPRVDPAMIVIVRWRDRCLLGTQPGWAPGRWSTLAGFIEPGESLEDSVRREVYEEAGVRVGACEYHSSQPWPFPSALMLGFIAEAEDPTINVGPELREARWFSADDVVDGLAQRTLVLPPRLSVSHELIAHWLRETSGLELAELLSDVPWQPVAS